MRLVPLFVLFSLFAACGLPSSETTDTCCSTLEQPLPPCDPDVGCGDSEDPPPPPALLAPSDGVYEGYATIIGYVGTTTSGCQPLNGRLFVRLAFTASGPDDATGSVAVLSTDASEYRFNSTAANIGGVVGADEQRTYLLQFSADFTDLRGGISYTRNATATAQYQCSGYQFDVAYRRL